MVLHEGCKRLASTFFKCIEKIILSLRHMKIQVRLIAAFVIISIIPTLAVGSFAYNQYTQSVNTKLSSSTYQLMEQLDKNIQAEISKFEHACEQITVDYLIQNNIENYAVMDDLSKGELAIDINEMLGEKGLIFSNILNVYMTTLNNEVFYELGYDDFDKQILYGFRQGADKADPLDHWTYARSRRGRGSLVLCRSIYSLADSSKKIGYIYIAIDELQSSQNIYSDINMGEGSLLFLMNEEGLVISSANNRLLPGEKYLDPAMMNNILLNQKKSTYSFSAYLDGKQYLTLYLYNSRTKWYLMSMIPFSYINSEISAVKSGLILMIIFCLFFSFFFSAGITLSIIIPINNMVKVTKKVSEGNLSISIHDDFNDEMGYLSNRFDAMVMQLDELNRQYAEDQKNKRELEFNMLQAQINPHFLFNTLNSLKWTAMLSRVTTVSDGIGALSDLLRNTIVNKNEFVPLKEELKNIENYLFIQKIRYGDSFEVLWDIDENMNENMIIKFLLQPIVENSIIHGLPENKRPVTITILCFQQQDEMVIEISDNGKGFNIDETLANMHDGEKKEGRLSAIGIDNVQKRIVLNYGIKYGLTIKSQAGIGTTARINLPIIRK